MTKYKNFDIENDGYPSTYDEFKRIEVEVEFVPGWKESLTDVASISDLPGNAKKFIDVISKYIQVPVEFVQIGSKETVLTLRDIIH